MRTVQMRIVLRRTDLRRTSLKVARPGTIAQPMHVRTPSVKTAHDRVIRGRTTIRGRTIRGPIVPAARLRDPMHNGRTIRDPTTTRVPTRSVLIIRGQRLSGRIIRARSDRTTTGLRKTSRNRAPTIDVRKTSRTRIHRTPTRIRETRHPRIAMRVAKLQTARHRNN